MLACAAQWLSVCSSLAFLMHVLVCDLQCHSVPRGSFAIPFANSLYQPMSAFEGKGDIPMLDVR